jgi:hypothetical protein
MLGWLGSMAILARPAAICSMLRCDLGESTGPAPFGFATVGIGSDWLIDP